MVGLWQLVMVIVVSELESLLLVIFFINDEKFLIIVSFRPWQNTGIIVPPVSCVFFIYSSQQVYFLGRGFIDTILILGDKTSGKGGDNDNQQMMTPVYTAPTSTRKSWLNQIQTFLSQIKYTLLLRMEG